MKEQTNPQKKTPNSKNDVKPPSTDSATAQKITTDDQKTKAKKKQQKKKLKRKKKRQQRERKSKEDIEQRYTIRKPEWSYLKMQMMYQPPYPKSQPFSPEYPPDALTWRTCISSSLSQFLGVTGTAISVDILSLGGSTRNTRTLADEDTGSDLEDEATVMIRVPKSDTVRFSAAIAAWATEREGRTVKMLVKGSSDFAVGICGGYGGRDVFE